MVYFSRTTDIMFWRGVAIETGHKFSPPKAAHELRELMESFYRLKLKKEVLYHVRFPNFKAFTYTPIFKFGERHIQELSRLSENTGTKHHKRQRSESLGGQRLGDRAKIPKRVPAPGSYDHADAVRDQLREWKRYSNSDEGKADLERVSKPPLRTLRRFVMHLANAALEYPTDSSQAIYWWVWLRSRHPRWLFENALDVVDFVDSLEHVVKADPKLEYFDQTMDGMDKWEITSCLGRALKLMDQKADEGEGHKVDDKIKGEEGTKEAEKAAAIARLEQQQEERERRRAERAEHAASIERMIEEGIERARIRREELESNQRNRDQASTTSDYYPDDWDSDDLSTITSDDSDTDTYNMHSSTGPTPPGPHPPHSNLGASKTQISSGQSFESPNTITSSDNHTPTLFGRASTGATLSEQYPSNGNLKASNTQDSSGRGPDNLNTVTSGALVHYKPGAYSLFGPALSEQHHPHGSPGVLNPEHSSGRGFRGLDAITSESETDTIVENGKGKEEIAAKGQDEGTTEGAQVEDHGDGSPSCRGM